MRSKDMYRFNIKGYTTPAVKVQEYCIGDTVPYKDKLYKVTNVQPSYLSGDERLPYIEVNLKEM